MVHTGATDPLFPFGFVQLGPNQNNTHSYNWPIVRWKQTAEQGHVPNSVLENVFMAAAMDDDMGNNHAGRYVHL